MKKFVWWLLILVVLGFGITLAGIQERSAKAAAANRVGLVIAYGNGTVKNQCISFSADKLSGVQVLQASGLPLQVSYNSSGAAVCKIGKVGCPVNNCFCDSPPNFWAYWHLKDGNWTFSQFGASSSSVGDGDVEGWVWGPGQSNPPAQTAFDQICAAQSTPTDGPTVTETSPPMATSTKADTPTPKPSRTPAPTSNLVTSTQAPDQPSDTPAPTGQPAQVTEPSASAAGLKSIYLPLISEMEDLPEDAFMPTELADISTPDSATPAPTSFSALLKVTAAQSGQTDPAAGSASNTGWGNYISLGAIVAGLGIALFVVTHKKWK